ncbi:DUF4430 domain-containing protein [Gracilibacillus caseinilyticus]|uniref:DUF4430 domain-containing protein n=1 Tax=Gracilibacillus caseinilyticus TaxID=2932256 RepID=A0ABY4ESZ5_9BACI|nr:DUF4430 domain-containing protein [Gracilibacillus caseinilyticus]UOQ47545.1 DUF4430 domain-containing protein [Gracilibacillus caseinilyticus]
MKQFKQLLIVIILAVVMTACGNTGTNVAEGDINVSLTITDQITNKTISEESYTVTSGTTLEDLLQDNYEVEVTEDGFLTSINGHEQNVEENEYWTYEANGEMVSEGIADYEVQDEDDITFDLQIIE